MAKQTSKTVIGGFVVSAIALLVAGVIVLGGGELFKKTITYVLHFEESIKGLDVGSPVVWSGVKVGTVSQVIVDYDPKDLAFKIPVLIELDPSLVRFKGSLAKNRQERQQNMRLAIDKGLRAQVTLQSMVTGQLMIDLNFHPGTPVRLSGIDNDFVEIPTIPSSMGELASKLKQVPIDKIANELLAILSSVKKVVAGPELKNILANVDTASQGLNQLMTNANTLVVDADGQVKRLSDSFMVTSGDAQKFLGDARKLVKGVDSQVKPVSDKVQSAMTATKGAMDQAQTSLKAIDGLVGQNSDTRNKLDRALEEIAAAAKSLNSLMDYLERHPESLLKGK